MAAARGAARCCVEPLVQFGAWFASSSSVVTPLFRYTSNQMIQFNHDKCRGYSQRESVRGSLFPALFNVGNSLIVCYSTRLTCAPLFINTPTEVELTSLFTRFHMQESQKVLSLGCLVSQEIKGNLDIFGKFSSLNGMRFYLCDKSS